MSEATIKIQTMLKDPTFERNGKIYVEPELLLWHDIVAFARPTLECNHIEMMCPECQGTWMEDHWIRAFDEASGQCIGINAVPGLPNLEEGLSWLK